MPLLSRAGRKSPGRETIAIQGRGADIVPESIAYRLSPIACCPSLQLPEPVRIVCRENTVEALLAELTVLRID